MELEAVVQEAVQGPLGWPGRRPPATEVGLCGGHMTQLCAKGR